jgi:peptidoglycan/LPS O-acetylase OafA/YrhL
LLYPFVRSNTAKLSTPSHIAIIILALGVVEFVGNNHPLLRICPEFTIGMIAYDLNLKFGLAQRFNRYFGCFVSALIIASTYLVATEHLALYAALFALLISALANDQDKLGRILSLPVLTYFGEISYSTYMVHVPVWTFLKNIARLDHVSVSLPLFITVTLLLALAVSAVTFHFVELPARRAIRASRRPIAEA